MFGHRHAQNIGEIFQQNASTHISGANQHDTLECIRRQSTRRGLPAPRVKLFTAATTQEVEQVVDGARPVAPTAVTRAVAELDDPPAVPLHTRHTGGRRVKRAETPRQRHQVTVVGVLGDVDAVVVTTPTITGRGWGRET